MEQKDCTLLECLSAFETQWRRQCSLPSCLRFIHFNRYTVKTDASILTTSGGIQCIRSERRFNKFVLTGGTRGMVALYDLTHRQVASDEASSRRTIRAIKSFPIVRQSFSSISSVDWYPVDAGLFLASDLSGNVAWYDSKELVQIDRCSLPGSVYCSKFGVSCLIASGTSAGNVAICDVRAGRIPIFQFQAHRGKVFGVDWSPLYDFELLSCGEDGTIRKWDLRYPCVQPAVSFDWTNDAVDTKDCTLKDSRGSRCIAHIGSVNTAQFTPTHTHVLSSGSDGVLRLWDGRSGALLSQRFDVSVQGMSRYQVSIIPSMPVSFDHTGRCFRCSDVALVPVTSVQGHSCPQNGWIAAVPLTLGNGGPSSVLKGHLFGPVSAIEHIHSSPTVIDILSGGPDGLLLWWSGAGKVDNYRHNDGVEVAVTGSLARSELQSDQMPRPRFTPPIVRDYLLAARFISNAGSNQTDSSSTTVGVGEHVDWNLVESLLHQETE